MEETIKRLRNIFGNESTGIRTLESKIAFATGYMRDNDDLTRKEALDVIQKIVIGQL